MEKLRRVLISLVIILSIALLVSCTGSSGGGGARAHKKAPLAPTELTIVDVKNTEIDLNWTINSDNEDGFEIERKTGAGGTYSAVDSVDAGASTYQNTGLSNLTTYYYRVRAYNSAGASDYSNEVNATTGFISIPAGCFNMGDAFSEGAADELPVHNVCLTAFQINRHEVTVGEYKACVTAGACTVPTNLTSDTRAQYYDNPTGTYDNFPVIYVNWSKASAYCTWAGGRLPTEAEWEYAARGGLAGKRYPWGDTIAGSNANYLDSGDTWDNDTSPVENYPPNGYGLYDVTGNVWEWVNDWYDSGYYAVSPTNDPPGPVGGTSSVMRGGSFACDTSILGGLRVSHRLDNKPTGQWYDVGFRCARAQ